MKKLVFGLVGVVLSFYATGCVVYKANEKVTKIRYHDREIRKIIGAKPEESYSLISKKKGSFQAFISGKNRIEVQTYIDLNGDGIFEKEDVDSIEIPDNLDMKIFPPDPNSKREGLKKYTPKKKTKKQRNFLAYDMEN